MFLGLSTLAVAIVISVVAAYYSVLGLTAIFAAAFWPIVIMGGALETGKIMTAIWLHRNWKRASWAYKSYLVPALVLLMLLTSMGIFGFLSKAHLDQAVPAGDVASQVQVFDDKIKTQRDNIETARAALKQLDAAVDQTMGRSTDEKGAERAVQIRRSQARERTNLQNDISRAQAEIVRLQEQRAPIASQLRKVEAEVGPIKYVAALIYGDTLDQNLLESAVRWVIILIVLVFDPLAVVLILAGSKQIEWARGINFENEDRHRETMRLREIEQEESLSTDVVPSQPATPDLDIDEANDLARQVDQDLDVDRIIDQAKSLQELEQKQLADQTTIQQQKEQIDALHKEIGQYEDAIRVLDTELADLENQIKQVESEKSEISLENSDLRDRIEKKNAEVVDLRNRQIELREQMEEALISAEQAIKELEELKKKSLTEPKQVNVEFSPTADDSPGLPATGDVSFGSGFPSDPDKGDLYLRVDYLPSKLFKWNGVKWIEIDKRSTDSYAYNEKYIKHLIERIDAGEYETDDLSDIERTQIDEYLKKLK